MAGTKTLDDLFLDTLKGIYYAENQTVEKLCPRWPELRSPRKVRPASRAFGRWIERSIRTLLAAFGLRLITERF